MLTGYERYLAVIADPAHAEHADMIEWRGPGFNPETVDVADLEKGLAKLARKLAPKAARPQPGTAPAKPKKTRAWHWAPKG